MNTTKYCSLVVFSLVTASAFAQMTSSDPITAPAPMSPSSTQVAPMTAPIAAPMNGGRVNDNGMGSSSTSGSTGMDAGRSGYDASGMPAPTRASGMSGSSMSAGSRMGDRSGYGVNGAQTNANDTHATPQPGSLNNQMYRGN